MKNDDSLKNDLSYIKTIMTKSQFSFAYGTYFFITLGVYFLIVNFIPDVYHNSNMEGFADIYLERLTDLVLQFVQFIPLAIIIWVFYKIGKSHHTDMSLWLYEICAFTIVACTIITPILLLPNYGEIFADIFSVSGVSICMFVCGKFLQNRKMVATSIVYFVVISTLFFVLGFLYVLLDTQTTQTAQTMKYYSLWVHVFLYATGILNKICAPIGYVVLGIQIYFDKKSRKKEHEV